MSIPLVQEATKDAINTSIIAIKRNIERINMLLGLSNSEEIDTSKFATKEELQQAVTDLQPVDEVAVDNMHSVTSNAVAESFGRINILSDFAYFKTLNTDITVNLKEDIKDETVLQIVLGTLINQSSNDIRLCDCPVLISKRLPCYIYNFYEARSNTQIKGLVKPYVLGNKQLILNFFDGAFSTVDNYCVFAVYKG